MKVTVKVKVKEVIVRMRSGAMIMMRVTRSRQPTAPENYAAAVAEMPILLVCTKRKSVSLHSC